MMSKFGRAGARPRAHALAAVALGVAALALAEPAPLAAEGERAIRVEHLAWLAGAWSGETDGVASEEHWTSPRGGGLVGMHKDVRDGRMVFFEFLRITTDEAGRVCYVASPAGAPPTSFCAVEEGGKRVVFENRQHDFPQRILYWLDADGRLHARVEGPSDSADGGERWEEWVWSRSAN